MNKSIFVLLFVALPAFADFERPAVTGTVATEQRMLGGMPAQVSHIQTEMPRSLVNVGDKRDFQDLDITFQVQTQDDFAKLKAHFQMPGKSQSSAALPVAPIQPVAFKIDEFLPPVMQALKGLRWSSLNKNVLEQQPVSANCWATAYEVTRLNLSGGTDFTILDDRDNKVEDIFNNPSYFGQVYDAKIRARADKPLSETLAPLLLPGDVLLIYGYDELASSGRYEYGLSHAAIYIGDGLYFEKFSDNDRSIYRLTDYENVYSTRVGSKIKTDNEPGDDSPQAEMIWFRPSGKPLPPLIEIQDKPFDVATVPSFREIPGANSEVPFPNTYRRAPLQISAATGRAEFPLQNAPLAVKALRAATLKDADGKSKPCVIKAGSIDTVDEVVGFWRTDGVSKVTFRDSPSLANCGCAKSEMGACYMKISEWQVVK